MSAIYQRARPIHWDEVVGQEHIKSVLRTALEQGRVGHAYLFSGPRGVGKTTTARLIAMTANCTGPDPKPCGECGNCRAVRAGTHPDVIEIDAASNNSVDDVRDLREKVGLAPMRGGKKIYILDEAHMMSRAAFNALLKTLEEPPGHVIFILATTEPEKIIPTILSRTQHYRFRRLTAEEIAGKLAGLAEKEGLSAEPEALNLMGRLADGAMRDGESLLERMLAAGAAITRRSVEDALGLPPGEQMRDMAAALVGGEAGVALEQAGTLYRAGFAARTVVEGLVQALSHALHAELGMGENDEHRLEGAEVPTLLRLQAALDEQLSRFAASADELSLELALTHALLAASAPAPGGLAAPVHTAHATNADLERRLSQLERGLRALSDARQVAAGAGVPAAPTRAARSGSGGAAPPRAAAPQAVAPASGEWGDVLQAADLQTRAFLKPAKMHAQDGYVSLAYGDKHAFHAKQVLSKWKEISALVQQVFGPVTFELISEASNKRTVLGGDESGTAPAPTSASAPAPNSAPATATSSAQAAPVASAAAPAASTQATSASAQTSGAGGEVPDFDPHNRRTPPPPKAPSPATPSPAMPSPAAPSKAPQPSAEIADFDPHGRAATPAAPAEEEGGNQQLRPEPPPSPDDAAPAPLPDDAPAPPWEDGPAAAPPAPQGAATRTPDTPAEESTRELYLGEPVTQEPVWDDLGAPPEEASAVPPRSAVQKAPSRPNPTPPASPTHPTSSTQSASPARPDAKKKPEPQRRPAQASPARAATPPANEDDIRAHPLFQEVTGRFQGQVREVGKNRRVAAEAGADMPSEGEADEG